jgi:hypothetical protein
MYMYNKIIHSASTNPLLEHGNPISGLEPTVALDVVDVVPQVAVPLGQVNLQQVPQQILQVRAKVRWETDLTTTNFSTNLI